MTDVSGKSVCLVNGLMDSLTATKYRMGQYDTFRDESKRKYLKYQILYAKKQSQLKLLQLLGSNMEHLSDKESQAARVYFTEFATNFLVV